MDSGSSDERNDEDSSEFSDSSDEEDQLSPVPDMENKITPKERLETATRRERKEIEDALENLAKAGDDISALTEEIDILIEGFFWNSPYQDVTPLFIDGSTFLLDASSLCACAVRESNYSSSHGGQTLHFIYICEKIIQLLCRKGGNCQVIFFKEKSKVWYDAPQLSLAENILRHHLKNNTEIPTLEIDSILDADFQRYIIEVQPSFIVLSFTLLDCLRNEFESQEMFHLYKALFSMYSVMSLSLGLYCVDINSLQLDSNAVMMYGRNSNSRVVSSREILQKYCVSVLNKFPEKETDMLPTNIDKFKTKDVRRSIMISVAESFINDNQFSNREELPKAVLLYGAVIEVFPITARCFNNQIKPTDHSKKIVNKIVWSINMQLLNNRFEGFDYSSVADLWHGNLFIEILSSVVSMQECDNLGRAIDKVYEEYISEFNEMTGMKLQKLPISFNNITGDVNYERNFKTIDECLLFSKINSDLSVVDNEIFNSFCKDVCSMNEASNEDENNYCHETVPTNLKWQNTDKLTGFIDRITDWDMERESLVRDRLKKISDPQFKNWLIKKALTILKGLSAYYRDIYAVNLEGNTLERRAIVCESPVKKPQNKKKSQKKDKLSKSAAKLIEENNLKKEKKLQEEENAIYVNFKKQYKSNSNSGKSYQVNLALINHVITNMKTDLYYSKVMMYKVETLFHLWEEECKKCKHKEERDLSHVKELFLAIREVMSCAQKESFLLGEREQAKIGKKLCQLGFKGLAQEYALPVIEDDCVQSNMDVSVNESCVRFQMRHLGSELLKNIELGKDSRAVDYIPDQWQRDMFDAIDKRQSALIVAPTSSGKTRASYYCMERVLRESNNSKVVYVAPTAAHMLQVAALAHYRFKGKAGIVQGILTKRYQFNVSECQILATVPECLEALFTTPEFHNWTKQLRYAIFDDVHCLTNCENGVNWEQCLMMLPCPFIALSASIQNPESLHSWMQKVERYKQELDPNIGSRVVIIVHSERHTDLMKHIYVPSKGLRQIHPVSCLTKQMMDAHQGIPKQTHLAPSEMIELYDVLVDVAGKDDPDLIDLEPEKYFSSGFISRDDAKKYESKIRQVLGDWLTNRRGLLDETVMRFRAQITSDCDGGNKTMAQVFAEIKRFVELLKNECMLPAIVFAYTGVKCIRLGRYIADVYREEEEKSAPKMKKKPIAAVDNDDFDHRNDKKPSVKKNLNHPHTRGLNKKDKPLNPLGLTEGNIQYSVRNVLSQSLKDFLFIEERLWDRGYRKDSRFIEMLRRGIGVIFSNSHGPLKRSVEWLFRKKFLNVLFANATADVGVRLPCKTVVVLGDSPLINTAAFHQICGRAGRRGLDQTGNIVFFGLDSNKVLSLQTAKHPKMNGNYPLTVTTVLRFLHLHSLTKAVKEKDDEKEKQLVLNRILTVLNECLLYEVYPDLRTQMKYYFGFCCHFLINLRLLNAESGEFHRLTSLVNILHQHEQGILAFVYLLEIGFFSDLCKLDDKKSVSETSCDTIMLIMCRLFTKIPFPTHSPPIDENEKKVDFKLPSLPPDAVKALQSYNNIVKRSFTKYYKNVAKFNAEKFGKDEKLPLSRKVFKGRCSSDDLEKDGASLESMIAKNSALNSACSVYAGLSGQTDDDLIVENAIIGNARDEIFPNRKCVPIVELDVALDAFAYNIYKHGIVGSSMIKEHLKPGPEYNCLSQFMFVLENITQSLEELQLVDVKGDDTLLGVRKTFAHIADTFPKTVKRLFSEGKL